MEIPRLIAGEEILVRFVFTRHFKNKQILESKIKDGEVFLDFRGVSHQRNLYCSEGDCKVMAKENPQGFVGFVLFRKSVFDDALKEYIKIRPKFEAELKATPLDENNILIPERYKIYSDMPGSPAHADLNYINPAVKEEEKETPKTAVRSFSRKLFKHCKLIFDKKPNAVEYYGSPFSKVV